MSKYHCNSFEMTHWMFWKWWWEEFRDRNLCFATFFSTKKIGKKTCPNIIAIVLKWLTECFESDGGKNLEIEISVLQHFFDKKNREKNMSKYHVDFEISFGLIFFFLVRHDGFPLCSPLCFPVVLPHCAYCREGPCGILRPETLETIKISKVSGRYTPTVKS